MRTKNTNLKNGFNPRLLPFLYTTLFHVLLFSFYVIKIFRTFFSPTKMLILIIMLIDIKFPIYFQGHLVLHPYGIAHTFLKFNLWSPGGGFISIILTKGINQIKKGNCKKKVLCIQKEILIF